MSPGNLRILVTALSTVVALSNVGCSNEQNFCTYAVYEARGSGYRLQVFGTGLIPPGSDLSSSFFGRILVCPLTPGKSEDVRLTVRDDAKVDYEIVAMDLKGTENWDWSTKGETLRKVLILGGLDEPIEAEVTETARVISGVMAGPKGTILDGQSELLDVVYVDYRYEQCSGEMSAGLVRRMSTCE